MNPIIYDDFDTYELKIPPRSKFYNLKPIGLGTPYTESLTSYISRLAECHKLKVTSLVCKNFAKLVKKEYLQKAFLDGGFGSSVRYINGNSPVSLEYVFALEELTTREDLLYLTSNSLSGLFPKNVIGDYRKWCPNCFEEWRSKGIEIYEPLIWYIDDINQCDKHGVRLEDRCPNCGKKLSYLHNNLVVGYCQYCSAWLGEYKQKDSNPLSEFERFLLNSFKELIEGLPNLTFIPTNIKIGTVLKKMFEDNGFHSISQFSTALGFPQTMISKWIRNKGKPSMKSIFKICKKVNLSIYQLFFFKMDSEKIIMEKSEKRINSRSLSVKETEKVLKNAIQSKSYKSLHQLSKEEGFVYTTAKSRFPSLCQELKELYLQHNKDIKNQKKKDIQQKILEAMEIDPPTSFQQFSTNYEVSIATAKRYLPDLSKKLICRYLNYQREMKETRYKSIKGEIRKIILELYGEGIYPGIKTVQRNLSNPNYFIKREFREVWEEEIRLLGYK